jgi:DNA-binding CsgD family transcriptional regulator
MSTKELSSREKEIVELATEGLTNEAIAYKLRISVGTVNTYWLRIRQKTGGFGRTDAVVSYFKERARQALDEERVDWEGLASILAKREISDVLVDKARIVELRTLLAMLHLAMDHVQSTFWSTDKDLRIHYVANGELASTRFGVKWEDGKTVYEIFKTTDKAHLAIAAHLDALAGTQSEQRLTGEFADMILRVVPIADEFGEVICCIGILNIGIV